MSSKDQPSFETLPREIRFQIYSYLFEDLSGLAVMYMRWQFSAALLRTSRSVYNEASEYFYSHNPWLINIQEWSYPAIPSGVVPTYGKFIQHFDFFILVTNMTRDGAGPQKDMKSICEVLAEGPRIKALKIERHEMKKNRKDNDKVEWRGDLTPLALLADHVDKVVVGQLSFIDNDNECRQDNTAHRQLKDIFHPSTKWSYPLPAYQYKD